MKLSKKLEKEPEKFLAAERGVEAIVESGFLHRKSKFFESIKNKARRILLIALMVLVTNIKVFAGTSDIMPKVLALYDSLKNNKIGMVEAAKQLNQILHNVDKEIKKDIEEKNFSEAKKKINLYMVFADGLGEKELYSKLSKLWGEIHRSFLEHVDLEKHGVYTDKTKSKIYFIGKIQAPLFKNISIRRQARDLEIRGEAIRMLNKFFKGKIGGSVTLTNNQILIADASKDGKTINFLFEAGGIHTKDIDTELIIINLYEKGLFVPFK